MSLQPLFEAFHCRSLSSKNRFVVAPEAAVVARDGMPGLDVASYYAQHSEHDVGLVLGQGAAIERPRAALSPHTPHFFGTEALAAWQAVQQGVQRAGGVMAPQLLHVGNQPAPTGASEHEQAGAAASEGPSGRYGPGDLQVAGVAMDEAAIEATLGAYANAAWSAQRMGFGAVELHAAGGSLLDQFFWDATNRREDRFGGATVAERSRFAVEVVRAVRACVGPDFAIILRVGQDRPALPGSRLVRTCQDREAWLAPLRGAGVDVFHCVQRHLFAPEFQGSPLTFAGWVKTVTRAPVIVMGEGPDLGQSGALAPLVQRFERGEFDLVALRHSLSEGPPWVTALKHGLLDQAAQAFKPLDRAL